jgi:spore maturation protein CgeB
MKMVIFGLTISSSWGNGHATLWRGLVSSLVRRGWDVEFFEKDVPYYSGTRDLFAIDGGDLVFYSSWEEIRVRARRSLSEAEVAIVTSYCPDGIEISELVLEAPRAVRVFYDLDTPVTLSKLRRGERTGYIGERGLGGFDLVLSFTGGHALDELRSSLGAPVAVPLYGHVDPAVHRPEQRAERFSADLSYLGTYAEDRQAALQELFIEPAHRRPDMRFVLGGAQYPQHFPWTPNIHFVRHLPPDQHATFYSSSRLTANLTRRDMVRMGWCPSGRLFEAAACAAPIVTDWWEGLDAFFEPGQEILVARNSDDVLAAIDLSHAELKRIGIRGQERVLSDHTSDRRAAELERIVSGHVRERGALTSPFAEA